MGILPEERDDFSHLKPSASVPTFIGRVMSHSLLGEPLIPPMRRVSTTDKLFNQHKDSPLFDLPPLALPGLTSRVSRNNSVALSLDRLDQAFLPPGAVDEDELIAVEGGFSKPLLSAGGLSVLCAWNYGFMLGSMNTASAAMRDTLGIADDNPNNDLAWGLCVSIFCLGALLGCAAAAGLANGLGRKRALLTASAAFTLGGACEASAALFGGCTNDCAVSPAVILMLLGRVIAGMASGATTVVVPIYLGELAPPHLRGAFGVMFQLACVCALLVAQVGGLPALLGTHSMWPMYILLGVGVPSALQLLFKRDLLESPQWLIGQGAADEAHEAMKVLCSLRGVAPDDYGPLREAVMKELDLMQLAALAGGEGAGGGPSGGKQSGGVYALLRDTKLRPSLRITVACAMAQQFSGINNAFNFSSTFLSANGIAAPTVVLIAILMNVGNVFVTVLSAWLMDRAGRRALLLRSTVAMAASIVVLTIALTHPGQVC